MYYVRVSDGKFRASVQKKKEKKNERNYTVVHSHERHPLIPLTLTEMIYLSH